MRTLTPILLVSLMLAMLISPMATDSLYGSDADTRAVSPKSLIDFEVTSIVVGDSSTPSQTWAQPDNSSSEYVLRGESIPVTMTFTQAGTSSQPAYAEGWMQVWHPIGFLVEEHYVNMTLSGQQSTTQTFYWTPASAHSAIDDHGYLYGGIILKGTIDGGLADDNEENNELERHMPVAVWSDEMENGFCGDVDGDNVIDCPNLSLIHISEPTRPY